MPTLRDIADQAGVSTCTASKILSLGRGHERYSDECRARVQAAARALGYSPNHAARSLRTGATGIVAFAIDWSPQGSTHAFESAMIAACETAARRRGLHLLVVAARGGRSALRTALDLVERSQCDGVILPGGEDVDDAAAKPRGAPVAFMGQVPPDGRGGELDDGVGIAAAVRHLAELGHRRAAWIGLTGSMRDAERHAAFTAACAAAGMDAGLVALPAHPPGDDQALIEHVRSVLLARRGELDARTALLCYNDLVAIGAYAALAELGRRVPRDVSVVGFDNVHAAAALPALTTVGHELGALAEAALAALRDGAGRRVVPSRLVLRASTGRAP